MKSFDLHVYTRLIFGEDRLKSFVDAIAEQVSSVHIITGGGTVLKLGYYDLLRGELEKRGVIVHHFTGIEPNPQARTIDRAAKEVILSGAQSVLALGGGSVMDAAKAIALLVHDNEPNIWPFVLGGPRKGQFQGCIPVFCVPTTAATASEVSPVSVVSNDEVNGKASIAYSFLRPQISWLNPGFTSKLPMTTTEDGASDILSHVFENYILGGNDSPLTDYYCEGVIQCVLETLPEIRKSPESYELRARLMWASTLALNGYMTTGRNMAPFLLHALEHSMSGYKTDLAHGRGLAILYPAYFNWLIDQDLHIDRFARLGRNIYRLSGSDKNVASGFIHHFTTWLRDNNLYQSMSSVGIPKEAHKHIAEYAINVYGRNGAIPACNGFTVEHALEIFERTELQK